MSEKKNLSGKIQVAILAIFIVFMPLGSWYYLQSGYNYNKTLMQELQDYGKVPAFSLVNQDNDTITQKDLLGKYFVAGFYKANSPSATATWDYARRILGQFDSQPDFYWISHSLNPLHPSSGDLKALAEKESLDIQRSYFLSGSQNDLLNLLNIGYKVPMLENRNADGSIPLKSNINQLPREYPFLVLVDSSLTIRNYYDVSNENSMLKLVEHLSVILPREKKGKAELRREKEK